MECLFYITSINLKHKGRKFQRLYALINSLTGAVSGDTHGKRVRNSLLYVLFSDPPVVLLLKVGKTKLNITIFAQDGCFSAAFV